MKNICEKLTHIHMVVYTWWCWHICKGEEVGVDVDQLGEGTEARVRTPPAPYIEKIGFHKVGRTLVTW